MKKLFALLLSVVGMQACLVKDTRHTLYLDPSGAVSWVVEETAVHSNSDHPAERAAEEGDYRLAVRAGTHPVASALAGLMPERLETLFVRDERPFTVRTEAKFGSVAEVAQAVLDHLGIPGRAELRREGDVTRLEVTCHPNPAGEADEVGKALLSDLLEEFSQYRFTLTEGRFLDAHNFRVENAWVAVPLEPPSAEVESGTVTFSLTWTVADIVEVPPVPTVDPGNS